MNNSFFALTRFLRDRGVDAHLLLTDSEAEQDHFQPSQDTYDDGYTAYTSSLSWGGAKNWFTTPKRRILGDLAGFDCIVGCGLSPAFAAKIGRPLDVFCPYGADLYDAPFTLHHDRPLVRLPAAILRRAQRSGIRDSRQIFIKLDFYPTYRNALDRLGVAHRQVMHVPVYYPEYDRLAAGEISPELRYRESFDRLRDRYGALVICQARHAWLPRAGPVPAPSKGNDVLIRGFADYVAESGRSDAGLILFHYGRDVQASRELCGQLGISDRVHWMPVMPRKELIYGVLVSDVAADQFPAEELVGAWGVTALETMVVGKPVLGRLFDTPESFRARVGFTMPPLVNVRSHGDVAAALNRLLGDTAEAAAVGRQSREWVLAEYGIDDYLAAFQETRSSSYVV